MVCLGKFSHLLLRVGLVIVFVLLIAMRVQSQEYPVAEAYLGFSMYNNEYGTDRHNSPGWHFNFGYNALRNLRLVADFGGQYHSTDLYWTNGKNASANDYQFLFGPELTIRNFRKITPFAHTLVGAAVRHYAVPNGNWICNLDYCYQDHFDLAREWGFATGVGGGLDWHVHPVVSVRLVQFDWVHTHLSRDNPNLSPAQGQLPVLKGWQDNYRFSCGVIFRMGSRGITR